MIIVTTKRAFLAAAALTLAAVSAPAWAQTSTIVIGYQTVVEPSKVPQADGLYETATGATIDWRRFDSGADVIAAIASGAIDIGYVGSSPLAAAASRELPIQTIFIAGLIGDSEALVARNGSGITSVRDLVGKRVAVPFVSTTHYSLLAALLHENVDPGTVQILNLRPPEIAAAWERGDIDAAYVWDPALGQIKQNGTVILTSAGVADWGAPTFDAWIVRTDFAEANPDAVRAFIEVTADAYAAYNANPAAWSVSSPEAEKIARITGALVTDVPALLAGYILPDLAGQAELLGGPTVDAIAATATFLAAQGNIPAPLPDYAAYVNATFVADVLRQ